MTVCVCAAAGRLSRLVRRKVAMLRAFYVGFLESFKGCLMAPPDLTDTLAQLLAWRSLLWLSMTWRRTYLTQSFSQHNIDGLISGITFIVLFSQKKPLRWKEINTHTHKHTHTHTHTHKCRMHRYCKMQEDLIKIVQPALLPLSPGRASDKKRHSSLFLILTWCRTSWFRPL